MYSNTLDEHPGFEVFLLIGTNIGQRENNLQKAISLISKNAGEILVSSKIYESAAWGKENQNSFLNQIIKIHTLHGPWELLSALLDIETQMGRKREEKWGERIIDLDILYFDEVVIRSFDLEIPHPGIPERKFTLIPMVEIDAKKIHPKLKLSQRQLLDNCEDQLWVKEWNL